MVMTPVRPALIAAALAVLSGCGTPEYRAERSHCEAEWMQRIPPVYRQQSVIRHRSEEQPSGEMTCETTGRRTICTPKMKTVQVPYEAVETVDIRKPERDVQIQSCTARACMSRYGNSSCET